MYKTRISERYGIEGLDEFGRPDSNFVRFHPQTSSVRVKKHDDRCHGDLGIDVVDAAPISPVFAPQQTTSFPFTKTSSLLKRNVCFTKKFYVFKPTFDKSQKFSYL